MATIRELLNTINEDTFLEKLSGENGTKTAMPITPGPGSGPAAAPGSATAPSQAPSGAQVTGVVHAGGPPNVMADQLGGTSADRRVQLMDAAMRAAGQELSAGDEANRGVGTDEEHNHGTQPSSGQQEYQNLAAPQTPVFQDNHQKMVEDNAGGMGGGGMGGGMEVAASVVDRLAGQVAGTAPAAPTAPETLDDPEKVAAAKIANECVAQGLFVERGIEMGLEKSAEEGKLAEIFCPSLTAAHEVALEKIAEDGVALDKVAEVLATKVVEKIAEKLGIAQS